MAKSEKREEGIFGGYQQQKEWSAIEEATMMGSADEESSRDVEGGKPLRLRQRIRRQEAYASPEERERLRTDKIQRSRQKGQALLME